MLRDIIRLLRKMDIDNDFSIFVMPWFYNLNTFVQEEQRIDQIWQQQTAADTERRFNELETRLEAKFEKKHNNLVTNLWSWSDSIVKLIPNSYASVTANQLMSHLQPFRHVPVANPQIAELRRNNSVSSVGGTNPRNRLGSTGAGTKRPRLDPQTNKR